MPFVSIVFCVLIVIGGVLTIYALRRILTPSERERTIAELEKLPPIKMDFSTPEGAILCLEATYAKKDIEAAVACHDFEMLAKVWLREHDAFNNEMQKEMLPGMTETMEKSYRESHARGWIPGWDKARSYFPKREPYADGLVAVSEVTVGPGRSLFRQCILVAETPNGWRVVTPLVKTPNGWRVTEPLPKSSAYPPSKNCTGPIT